MKFSERGLAKIFINFGLPIPVISLEAPNLQKGGDAIAVSNHSFGLTLVLVIPHVVKLV